MRRRLILLAAAVTSMVAIAFLVPLALLVRTVAAERALASARQVATALAPAVAVGDDRALTVALQTVTATTTTPITVFLHDGRTLGAPHQDEPSVRRAREGTALTEQEPDGLALYTPLLDAEGGTAVVRVLIPTHERYAGVYTSWAVLAALGVALNLGAVAIADRLGRSVVRPSREIAAAARSLSAGDRSARAPVQGPPELADIATALNGLADRIEAMLRAERETAADLSHRLRTPMTALRLDVESLPEEPGSRRLAADLDELERAVDRLIRDARSPSGQPTGSDLVARTRDRTRFWSALADEEGRPCEVALPQVPLPVTVPGEDLDAVLDALIGNVLAHTAPGTAFRVEVVREGDTARLVVEDEGPGWPARDVLRRGESGRGSTGLGLDIVRRTAEQHGGVVVLDDRPGGGARITVRVPRSA